MLANLNTRATANGGLALGLITAVGAFFRLLSDPDYLTRLYWAFWRVDHHSARPADVSALAQLAGVMVAILGALLLSYLGRPSTIPPPSGSTAPPPKGQP